MFCRCQARNLARTVDPRAWTFGDQSGPSGAPLALDVSAGGCDVLKGNDDAFNAICRKLSDLFPGEHKLLGNASHPYNRTAAKAPFRSRARTDAMLVMAHGYIDRYQHEFSGLLVASDPMGIALRPIPVYGTRYFDFRDLPLRRFPPEIHTTTKADLLTAAELEIDAPLETQLVVLLACSAGWGRMRDGDEPASIAEKFLHIGAPTVVAPLWESDIDAAYAWTDAFLTGWLRQGQPKALAARDAYRKTKSAFQDQPQKFGVMALKGDWL
jgi:CHAT domain-containing protein